MPVTKADVVRAVKQAASSTQEKDQLLALAGAQPSLWDGLDQEDVVGVLRAQLQTMGELRSCSVVLQLVVAWLHIDVATTSLGSNHAHFTTMASNQCQNHSVGHPVCLTEALWSLLKQIEAH